MRQQGLQHFTQAHARGPQLQHPKRTANMHAVSHCFTATAPLTLGYTTHLQPFVGQQRVQRPIDVRADLNSGTSIAVPTAFTQGQLPQLIDTTLNKGVYLLIFNFQVIR